MNVVQRLKHWLAGHTPPKSTTDQHPWRPGTQVWVYDRFRFAVRLKAQVLRYSDHNDGVEVQLLTSNNPKHPVGSAVWVHAPQIGRRGAL